MSGLQRYERRDWIAAAGLFLAGVALHAPFCSRLAYHWDSVQFALGICHYNLLLSEPHAPGYFLYVMAGRLLDKLVGDPHASLLALSLLCGGGLAAVAYLLGAAMFGRRAGAVAALLALTSPQVWFHSCVALTYIVDGFLVCLTVWRCWRAMQSGGSWIAAATLGALLGLAGGVRLQTVPGLLPAVVFVIWRFRERRVASFLVAGASAVIVGAAWFVPMLALSGGWSDYTTIVNRFAAFNAPLTLAGGGTAALATNVASVTAFCWNGLMLGVGALLAGALALGREPGRRWLREHRDAVALLAFWVAPMMLIGTAVSFTRQPGFVLSYLPALLILAAAALAGLERRTEFVVATAAVCAVKACAFLAWPPAWDGVLFHVGRTAREIRQHDQRLAGLIATIRTRYQPAETVVCHALEFYLFGMRLFAFYLPEFDHYQFEHDATLPYPEGRPLWRVRGGRTEFAAKLELAGKRRALLVVPPGQSLKLFESHVPLDRARMVEGTEGMLYELPAEGVRP